MRDITDKEFVKPDVVVFYIADSFYKKRYLKHHFIIVLIQQ